MRVVLCAPIKKILSDRSCQSKRISDGGDKSVTITEIMRKTQIFGGTGGFCSLVISFQSQSFCLKMLIHFTA